MSEDELKLTRRRFLQHTAAATAMSAGACSIALKTDALAQNDERLPVGMRSWPSEILPYVYHEES